MSKSPSKSRAVLGSLAALAGLVAGACVYDAGQRCGPAMMFVEAANACVCDSNAIAVAGGCQPCAADEVPAAGTCACPAGQTKSANNVCVAVSGFGLACDTATAPCADATYSYCAAAGAGTAGTCTKACASNTDCDTVYTCATWGPHPYCRTFAGVGVTCTSSADCVGDAKFCETFQTHSCVVAACSLTANDCPRGSRCVDYSGYGLPNICTPSGP
jgi:hypothetical protein